MNHFLAKLIASTSAFLLSTGLVLAQSVCEVNGQEVPCDQMTENLMGAAGFGLGVFFVFFGILLIVSLVATVFWILMIIHAVKHDVENKAMWVILMVFTGLIGALIYYFVVKREFDKKKLLQ